MSDKAGQNFEELGALIGLSRQDLPMILRGAPVSLDGGLAHVPTDMPYGSRERLDADIDAVRQGCYHHLFAATSLSRNVLHAQHPDAVSGDSNSPTVRASARKMVGMMLPDRSIEGHMTNFSMEALLESELPPVIMDRIQLDRTAKHYELHTGIGCLVLRADMYTETGYVGPISVLGRYSMVGSHDEQFRLTHIEPRARVAIRRLPEYMHTLRAAESTAPDS